GRGLGTGHSNHPGGQECLGRDRRLRSDIRRLGDGCARTRPGTGRVRQRHWRPELRFATRQGLRREYSGFGQGTGAGREPPPAPGTDSSRKRIPDVIIDTNVNLSRWPFRRLAGDETPDLVARLRQRNVTQAWAGSFDGILHKDIGGVNARLSADCRTHGKNFLVPFGSINPKLPGWQEDVERCHEDYKMPGVRLHPNSHGYPLTDPVFAELLHLAAGRRLIVQLVLSMEDIRTQHPLVRVPPVDVSALPRLLESEPTARLMLLNWGMALRGQSLKPLVDHRMVCFDISMVEGVEGVARLVERVPVERVVFGSYFPFFVFEAALLKMKESGLPEDQQKAVFEGNARRMLQRTTA